MNLHFFKRSVGEWRRRQTEQGAKSMSIRPIFPAHTPWVPENEQVSLSILSIKYFSFVANITLVFVSISTWKAVNGFGWGKTGNGEIL